MRVLPCIVLDGLCDASVRITLSQNRVNSTAKHLRIGVPDFSFRIRTRLFGIIRKRIALRLKLFDSSRQLRNRGTDIGQFDDVGRRRLGQVTEFRQRITLPLFIR